jgi:hypothetical protein
MNLADYRRMTQRLIAIAKADDRMIGLVALGSMADDERVDQWSDHDCWVIATPEAVDEVRDDPDWLPDQDRIVGWFVETKHGRSAVYGDGHLLEYAVFAPDELDVTYANDYRVLIGDEGLERRIEEIAAKTRDRAEKRRAATEHRLGRLVVHLVIGLSRYARGEDLSAHEHVKHHALLLLVGLLGEQLDVPGSADLDNLDPYRRFEFTHPEIGYRLNTALQEPIPFAVDTYLELIDEHLPKSGDEVLVAVRRLLSRATTARR